MWSNASYATWLWPLLYEYHLYFRLVGFQLLLYLIVFERSTYGGWDNSHVNFSDGQCESLK